MRGIGVGMQQTYADCLDAIRAKVPGRPADAVFIERAQFFAEEIEPAADLTHIV